jgi:hypothetical protein
MVEEMHKLKRYYSPAGEDAGTVCRHLRVKSQPSFMLGIHVVSY